MESKGTSSQLWQQDEFIKNIFHRGKFSLQSISMALAVSFFSSFFFISFSFSLSSSLFDNFLTNSFFSVQEFSSCPVDDLVTLTFEEVMAKVLSLIQNEVCKSEEVSRC